LSDWELEPTPLPRGEILKETPNIAVGSFLF